MCLFLVFSLTASFEHFSFKTAEVGGELLFSATSEALIVIVAVAGLVEVAFEVVEARTVLILSLIKPGEISKEEIHFNMRSNKETLFTDMI